MTKKEKLEDKIDIIFSIGKKLTETLEQSLEGQRLLKIRIDMLTVEVKLLKRKLNKKEATPLSSHD